MAAKARTSIRSRAKPKAKAARPATRVARGTGHKGAAAARGNGTSRDLLTRLKDGAVICAEGYVFELERRGYDFIAGEAA